MSPRAPILAIVATALLACGCGRDEAAVYRVPREKEAQGAGAVAPDQGAMAGAAAPAASGPGLSWDAPPSWKPKPASEMRRASYGVPGDCDLSVTAFPGDVGGELANVNRWRGQVGLAPLGAGELDSSVSRIEPNGLRATLVELEGAGAQAGRGMIGAIVPLGDSTWFFKLSGPAGAVGAAKGDFLGFVRSVRAPAAAMASEPVPVASGSDLVWSAPASWEPGPASAMRKASYRIVAGGGACDLSVTAFPGDVGGELANVNRWRSQLGLPELPADGLDGALSRFEANGLAFAVADIRAGEAADARAIVGASVPFAGSTWFFKLSGPVPAVAAAKPQFLEFLRGVRAP
jgi:hypothetical protein